MKNLIKGIHSDFINLFFPTQCLGCKTPLTSQESKICVTCQLNLPLTFFHQKKENPLYQVLSEQLKIEEATSLCFFRENEITESLIYELKYNRQEHLGTYFGKLLGPLLASTKRYKKIDAVLPVPLHPKREKKRGYNQVFLFGKIISNYLDVPFVEDALLRVKNTPQMAKTKSNNRKPLLEDAFYFNSKSYCNIKHWLLVDDIVTTGATLEACGSLLLENPKNRLSIATIGYRI